MENKPKLKLKRRVKPKLMASEMPVFGTRLDPELVYRVKVCAATNRTTMKAFISEALERRLKELKC